MSNRSRYIGYFIKNAPSTVWGRLFHKSKPINHFCGTKGITTEKGGEILKAKILAGKPFCAIRFGAIELGCLNNHEKIRLGFKKTYKDSVRYSIKHGAGVYPTDDKHLNEYCEEFEKEASFADILAISGIHMEDYFAAKLTPKAEIISNWSMEPLLGMWSGALKGKKVLVISPFNEEIKSQYARRDKLFPSEPDILPDFELSLIKAPETLGDVTNFPTPSFIETLKDLERKISATDFDIALVGAGAYGSLLCLYCRRIGKMAIQSGGATQTLFGIIGKRWENRSHVATRINEYWIRPNHQVPGYEKIDKGAYW